MQDDEGAEKRGLSWRLSDYESPRGSELLKRYSGLVEDVARSNDLGTWQYFRRHLGPVREEATVADESGRRWSGLNFASQDYLGLASHPEVTRAVAAAIVQWGVHSSGSAPMGGGSQLADEVVSRLSAILAMPHVLLFPTGWAAGYGAIKGLVRRYDHVLIDALAHNCLFHGSFASTQNVHRFRHNDTDSLHQRIARIRARHPEEAILVVTEGLYSMDSDTPDMAAIIDLKTRYGASLMVDVAHDFGVLGRGGRGVLSEASFYNSVDIVVGSFSKTFATIGGFVALHEEAGYRAIQGFSGSHTFSNFLIPPQLGAAAAAMDITFSDEGERLRLQVVTNAHSLREALTKRGIATSGQDSPLVIVHIGDESRARIAYRSLLRLGIITNCVEFPAVRKGEARFRLQLTPNHTIAQIARAADAIGDVLSDLA